MCCNFSEFLLLDGKIFVGQFKTKRKHEEYKKQKNKNKNCEE